MKLSAVLLARVLGFVETFDLNPRGTVFYPDLVAGIVERFRFQKFPEKYEELDETKGVEFLEGTWGGTTIEKLTIYNNGILLDTRASTSDSDRILEEALVWAASKFKLQYQQGMIQRKRYLSNLTFESDVPILQGTVPYVGGPNTPIAKLCDRVGRSVAEILGQQPGQYEATRLDLDFDRFDKQIPIAPFSIQRRLTTPFAHNKYFSEAPLQTDLHLQLLQEFEADLMAP